MFDPGNAGRRVISPPYVKVSDFLMAQGDLAEALKSYRDSLAVADRLLRPRTCRLATRCLHFIQKVGEC